MRERILSTIERRQSAVQIPVTRKRAHYISSAWVLNLSDGAKIGGDWHEACWFLATPDDDSEPDTYKGTNRQVREERGAG